MDAAVTQQSVSALDTWVQNNGTLLQLISFGAQILFWLGMLAILLYAVMQFRRWVNFATAGAVPASESAGAPADESYAETKKAKNEDAIKIEEFVE